MNILFAIAGGINSNISMLPVSNGISITNNVIIPSSTEYLVSILISGGISILIMVGIFVVYLVAYGLNLIIKIPKQEK